MATSFYSREELHEMGFKKIGDNAKISRNSCFYNISEISIGDNVRIDDFCVLSGKIDICNNIHIAVFCAIFGGKAGVTLNDFSGLSSKCVIYATTDDYSGNHLTNPTIPDQLRGITYGHVEIERHVILGTGVTVLPGVTVGEGTAVGSMSLINKPIPSWGIYAGIPCKFMGTRSQRLLSLEHQYLKSL